MPTAPTANRISLSLHGLGVSIACETSDVEAEIRRVLRSFKTDAPASLASITSGVIRRYDQTEVLRCLSPSAIPVATPGMSIELYQEGERFWLVDDRWGLCELNVMKGTFRSWVLPRPTLDLFRVMEMAVIWPIAQLLRPRGLYLIPAASVSRSGSGVLILSPMNLEAELRTLIRAGYNLVGQRWSALRESTGGGIELLAFPGQIEREASSRLREGESSESTSRWVDLTAEHCGVEQDSAPCDAVAVIEPSRRPTAHVAEVTTQRAADLLRRAWPIAELHPFRKQGQLSLKLSQKARCGQVQLSRRPEDFLVMLETVRGPAPGSIVTMTAAGLSAPPKIKTPPPMQAIGVRQPPSRRWHPARAG